MQTSAIMKLLKFVCSSAACVLGASGYCYFSGAPWFFSNIVMPSSKWMDPERAHRVAVYLASKNFVPKDRDKDDVILVRSAFMLRHIILRRMLPPMMSNWLSTLVGRSPTSTKNERSGVKPIPGFVPTVM